MSGKRNWFVLSIIWLFIFGAVAVSWKLIVSPYLQEAEEVAEQQEHDQIIEQTSADSHYKFQTKASLDEFSGYAPIRSPNFKNEMRGDEIKISLIDDKADYNTRFDGLISGEAPIAAMTIDGLIAMSAEAQDTPVVVVALVDETRGADAMVGFKNKFPNVDAVNQNTKFILTRNTPSEMLVRVLQANFPALHVKDDSFIPAEGSEAVYKYYRQAKPTDDQVYVVWQPFVTKFLENPNVHVIIDSSKFKGYIVDAIVVQRDFLLQNRDIVASFVKAYFASVYNNQDMVALVREDARKLGNPLSLKQAQDLVAGIWWKNTQENYAHFGVKQSGSIQHIEDIISNITGVLVKTGAIKEDPTNGKPNLLYYPGVLQDLYDSGYHPGIDIESVRDDSVKLAALTDAQWEKLVPVGTLEVPPLIFGRGTSTLSKRSHVVLDDLSEKLKTFPHHYLLIRGDSTLRGDKEANKALAQQRAQAAANYLSKKGIEKIRIKAVGIEPTGSTSVQFVLGEVPY